jgi:ketosteroid isomerase-like protein
MTDTVKYVVVWRREAAGEWKWAVDIWNGDS